MTLALYLSRVLGIRVLAAGAVFLVLAVGLDLMQSGDVLVSRGGADAMARYALLRTPQLAATVFPVGVLVGAVSAFLTLGNRSELTVMRASGLSLRGMLMRLAPLALVMGLGYNLLADRAASWAGEAIAEAFPTLSESAPAEVGTPVRSRQPQEVVIGRLASPDGTALAPVSIYRLTPEGLIRDRVEAERAVYTDGAWRLSGAVTTGGQEPPRLWSTRLDPAAILRLARPRQGTTAAEAAEVLAGRSVGARSEAYYRTRIERARAAIAVPAVLIVVSAFAGFKISRSAAGLRLAALGTAAGLGYIAVDGLFASFGEVGILRPVVAAYAPTALVGLLGFWVLLMLEE